MSSPSSPSSEARTAPTDTEVYGAILAALDDTPMVLDDIVLAANLELDGLGLPGVGKPKVAACLNVLVSRRKAATGRIRATEAMRAKGLRGRIPCFSRRP